MTNNAALYGTGKGSAQVIDTTSGAQQQFGQILARQQAQRQQELKQLTDQQAQLKPDGLRNDADRQDFFNQVNDWRNKSIAAINERDPYKKSLAQSEANQAYMGAQQTAAKSKQAYANEQAFGNQLLQPTFRDHYSDDTVNNFSKNRLLGVNDKNYVSDFNTYEQVADHAKALADLDKMNQQGIKSGTWDNGVYTKSIDPVTGQQVTNTKYTQTYAPEDRVKDLSMAYDMNKNLKKTLLDIYPQFSKNPDGTPNTTLTPDQIKQGIIQQYIKDSGEQSLSGNPQQKTAETMSAKEALQLNAAKLRSLYPGFATAQAQQPPPFEHNFVATIQNGGVPAVQKMLSYAPPEQFRTGEQPKVTQDANGIIKVDIPDQVELKPNGAAILKANKQAQADYEKNPDHKGWFGRGAATPWEQSDAYSTLHGDEANNPYKSTKAVEPIYIDPKIPIDIQTNAAILADKLHIPVTKINAMLGGTGGHGLNADVKQQIGKTAAMPKKQLTHGGLNNL